MIPSEDRGASGPRQWFTTRAIRGLVTALLLGRTAAAGGLYGANLVANPGFEDYYTTAASEYDEPGLSQYPLQTDSATAAGVQPWVSTGYDVPSIRRDANGRAHSGVGYAMGGRWEGNLGQTSRMQQDIDLAACGFPTTQLDDGTLRLSAGGYLSSSPDDADMVGLRVSCLDAAKACLAVALWSRQTNRDVWLEYRVDGFPLPDGTRYIRVEIEFIKYAGANCDGYADDIWVRLTPTVPPSPPMLDQNLLANPGFEAATSGWTAARGNPRARLTGLDGVPSHSGSYLVFGGQRSVSDDGQTAVAWQEIDLTDYGFSPAMLDASPTGLYLYAAGWLYSWSAEPRAQAKYVVTVLNGSGEVLSSFDSGRMLSSKSPRLREYEVPLPPGARRIVYTYDAVDTSGGNLDGYLDDAAVMIRSAPHACRRAAVAVQAHRGHSIIAPENTLASLRAAKGVADWCEFDIYACDTGELVLMHDSTVDRTTDGTGSVSSLSFDVLRTLDAGSWFSPDFAGERVPTLAEAVETLLPEVTPVIERKGGSAAAIVAELQRLGVANRVYVISFSWSFLSQVHALDPTIRLGALGSGTLDEGTIAQILATGADLISWADGAIDAATVQRVHVAGLKLSVWTVNSPTRMQELVDLGADSIVTDDPRALRWIVCPPCGFDFDRDGDVDLNDFSNFQSCFSGPGRPASRPDCAGADAEGDGDVDVADFASFQLCFNGSSRPPACD